MTKSKTKVIKLSEQEVRDILSKHILDQGHAIREIEFDINHEYEEGSFFPPDDPTFEGVSVTVLA